MTIYEGHPSARPKATTIPLSIRAREMTHDVGKRAAGRIGVGLTSLMGSRAGSRAGILVYHRTAWRAPGLPRPSINVPPDRFREQLQGLLERGFTFWSLERLLDAHTRGIVPPRRTIAVTFDDGYECVYRNVWPVLRELEIPATIFVNTAYLDDDIFPFDDWALAHRRQVPPESYRPLRWPQCHEMAAGGIVTFGAHTATHRDFRGRTPEFRADVAASASRLRAEFNLDAVTFSFPFGRPHLGFVTDDLRAAARGAGVNCGLTTENALVDLATDPFTWGRFNSFDFDTAATLAAKLDGWYGWAPAIQEWFVTRRRPAAQREAGAKLTAYAPR